MLLLHGLEGSPTGAKAQALRRSFDLVAPALPTGDFDACVQLAREATREHTPDVLVGSSFGGAGALQLLQDGRWTGPTLLLAPASRFLLGPVALPDAARILIVHGRDDAVVPIEQSRDLAATHPCVRLVEVDDGHRLSSLLEGEHLGSYVEQAARL
ncbi:MAG TPA: hypothetical protein PKD61_16480 [Polyangiaceae bacterium]|nr:hypothetical protein [Polyangiaceae bacterium]